MSVRAFQGKHPQIDPSVFIAEGARIIGDVTLAADVSVWFNTVIRADSNYVRVGRGTNIQDLTMIHVDPGPNFVEIGEYCTIGHRAVLHGCRIGNECLVGMGAIILNQARVGDRSIIAAGALVPEGKEYPPDSLLMGAPAKVVRTVTPNDLERIRQGVHHYIGNGSNFKAEYQD